MFSRSHVPASLNARCQFVLKEAQHYASYKFPLIFIYQSLSFSMFAHNLPLFLAKLDIIHSL